MQNQEQRHRRNLELCQYLWGRLAPVSANITEEDIIALAAIFSDFLETPEGIWFAANRLNCSQVPANYLHTFKPSGISNVDSINPKDLVMLNTWLYKGERCINPDLIIEDTVEETLYCENCQGHFPKYYCTSIVNEDGASKILCNFCQTNSSDQNVRSMANRNKCNDCIKTLCHHHPRFAPKYVKDLKKDPFRRLGEEHGVSRAISK